MGMRLLIEVLKDGKLLANCYYHWSAYTFCAAELTKTVINKWNDIDEAEDPVVRAVYALESSGGSLSMDSRKLFKEEYPDSPFADRRVDRDDGIIAIDTIDMNQSRSWYEYSVDIDFGTMEVSFGVINKMDSSDIGEIIGYDEYAGCKSVAEFKGSLQEIACGDYNLNGIPIDEFEKTADSIDSASCYFKWNNEVFGKIE